jgi:UDP-N-acetylmuramoyl-L-alanyl-D-glutamate--2,6-diaminopimelate ligase
MMAERTMNQLLGWLGLPETADDFAVRGLSIDSRTMASGEVFVAMSGFNVHGMDYAYQAARAGAVAVLTEPVKPGRAKRAGRQEPLSIPVFECADLSEQLGQLASEFYGHPSQQLGITAITGTNGKTSTAWLLMHALEQLGVKAGYMGTLGVGDAAALAPIANTTPSAIDVQKYLANMVASGIRQVCVEVSSHALDQGRFNGTAIDQAVFTNLSRDHLDYHRTMKAYAAAKFKLFTDFNAAQMIINADDEWGTAWLSQLPADRVISYGIRTAADWLGQRIRLTAEGIAFELQVAGESVAVESQLLGDFNVENLLAVMAVLSSMGHALPDVIGVVAGLIPVPGRMNRIDVPENGSTLVVDYAHTPDALEQVLKTLKKHTGHELWCVFGCGGNRDKGKRPMMGSIAERYADHVILTDDNPRFESSQQILADIEFGMQTKPHVIANRKQAIAYVIDKSQAGDMILVAGKGHESTQEVEGELMHFNDMEVVRKLLGVAA